MSEKKERDLQPRKPVPCRQNYSNLEVHSAGKTPQIHNALPRDCEFSYMTPGYYATGFRISDVYKTEVDFSEYRSLTFLEDPKLTAKWGHLKTRIPYPEGRITDLPGTRDMHYRNYCLRNLTAKSARSWRESIQQNTSPATENPDVEEANKPDVECVCDE